MFIAQSVYNDHHPKYADCLMDYGFFLLNSDRIPKSLCAYNTALEVKVNF